MNKKLETIIDIKEIPKNNCINYLLVYSDPATFLSREWYGKCFSCKEPLKCLHYEVKNDK